MRKSIYDDRNNYIGELDDPENVIRTSLGYPFGVIEANGEVWSYEGEYLGVLKDKVLHKARTKRMRTVKIKPERRGYIEKIKGEKIKKFARM